MKKFFNKVKRHSIFLGLLLIGIMWMMETRYVLGSIMVILSIAWKYSNFEKDSYK
jgi:hypothetical protein